MKEGERERGGNSPSNLRTIFIISCYSCLCILTKGRNGRRRPIGNTIIVLLRMDEGEKGKGGRGRGEGLTLFRWKYSAAKHTVVRRRIMTIRPNEIIITYHFLN